MSMALQRIHATTWMDVKMRYINFASGSKGNSTLIQAGSTQLVIDCGTTKRYLTQSLHNYGLDLNQIDALLITHDHGDHISQLKTFKHVPEVYSPVPLRNRENVITPIPYQPFMIKDIWVQPIVLSHDTALTYGYIIKHQDETLVYVTDTGYLKAQDYDYIRNATYYIFESNHDVDLLMQTNRPYPVKSRILSDSGHLSNADSAAILADVIGPLTREIILAHLSEEANTPSLALSTLIEALQDESVHVHPELRIACAKQFECLIGGTTHEEYSHENLDLAFAHIE
jgi:phosphoribosyl 1,2-cyclic phosphodiesterase